jgi:hypothetical protein
MMQSFNPELMGGKPLALNFNDDVPQWATRQNTYNAPTDNLGIVVPPKVDTFQQGRGCGTIATDNFSQGTPFASKPQYKLAHNENRVNDTVVAQFPTNYIKQKKAEDILGRNNGAWWVYDNLKIDQTQWVNKQVAEMQGDARVENKAANKAEDVPREVLRDFTQYKMTATNEYRSKRLV